LQLKEKKVQKSSLRMEAFDITVCSYYEHLYVRYSIRFYSHICMMSYEYILKKRS